MSRRQMLGLAGVTAIGASPALKAAHRAFLGDVEMITTQGRIAFKLGGQIRWQVRCSHFAGSPTLDIKESKNVIRFALSNARFPGLTLPADFVCKLARGLSGWRMDLETAFGARWRSIPFERWLAGVVIARSYESRALSTRDLKSHIGLKMDENSEVELTPDWMLRWNGSPLASLSGLDAELSADSLELALATSADARLLKKTYAKTTLVRIDRNDREWRFGMDGGTDKRWKIKARANAFDSVRIEASESRSGRSTLALLADSERDTSTLLMQPDSALSGADNAPLQLPLRKPRFALAYEPSGTQSALIAPFGREGAWLHTDHGSALVGDDGTEPMFELVRSNDAIERLECAPALLATYMPMAGVLTEPTPTPAASTLAFLDADAPTPQKRAAAAQKQTIKNKSLQNTLQLNPGLKFAQPSLSIANWGAVMIRPEDLLILRFEFRNLKLQSGLQRELRRVNTGKAAYIIVHFQPQNIGEEAFWESAPELGDNQNENLDPPPVRARISGPSRIVFVMPAKTAGVPYTLEDLLAAISTWEMRVAPHAKPPSTLLLLGLLKNAASSLNNKFSIGTASSESAKPNQAISRTIKSKRAAAKGTVRGGFSSGKGIVSKNNGDVDLDKTVANWGINYSQYDFLATAKPQLRAPLETETAIETPYRLIVSPNKYGGWAHSPTPVAHNGWTELWHTRLGVLRNDGSIDEVNDMLRKIRAIWSPDCVNQPEMPNKVLDPGTPNNNPFRMSLDSFDRVSVVNLTANYRIQPTNDDISGAFEPIPVDVNRLMLSSLGAWMDTRGAWDTRPKHIAVEEWKHRATMGRDHYVKVVYAGFLFPFGHRASLVKVTERKFHNSKPGNVAYLRQRMFLVVRERERSYGNSGLANAADESYDLHFPFTKVRVETEVTPNLDDPQKTDYTIPDNPNSGSASLQSMFWPSVGDQDFLFHLAAEDLDGNSVEWTAPLAFVMSTVNDRASNQMLQTLADDYESKNGARFESRRKRPMEGQDICYAESLKKGDTTFDTEFLTFGAEVPEQGVYASLSSVRPRFYPIVLRLQAPIPAIRSIVGQGKAGEVEYHQAYLKYGFDDGPNKNKGAVFLKMAGGDKIEMSFNGSSDKGKGDKAGGLVKPNMQIGGLSRKMGPVAGNIDTLTNGSFNPQSFFDGFSGPLAPKIFGCINLWDIIEAVGLDDLFKVPKFINEGLSTVDALYQDLQTLLDIVNGLPGAFNALVTAINNVITDIGSLNTAALAADLASLEGELNSLKSQVPSFNLLPIEQAKIVKTIDALLSITDKAAKIADILNIPKELKITFEWTPKLKSWGIDPAAPIFIVHDNEGLRIAVELRAPTNGGDPSAQITCGLYNFSLNLLAPLSFLQFNFSKIEFFANTGAKADVNVEFDGIEFVGVLAWVETIRDYIPLDGFSDPPAIDVTARGITAMFSLALPNVTVGVFAMTNMSLNAGFNVPFIGDPLSVYFSFCTRENPFCITFMCIGGGGFFGIQLTPAGMMLLEASLELGASLSIDFGVASGSVSIMIGVYLKLEYPGTPNENCMLMGYVRIRGKVSVLGIISASIELNLTLTYEFSSGKVVGRAELTIEIEVFFFSASVTITAERKFAGSNGDPTMEDLMAPYMLNGVQVKPWDDYCGAFA